MANSLVMAVWVLLAVCLSAGAVEIIAHRGASQDAPENTLASLKLGYEQGADAGELDIHLTRDGKIAVIHDSDTQRTSGVAGKIAAQSFADLRKLDVGAFGKFKGKGFSEKIPSLDEALAIVPAGRKIFIEIKCREEALPALEESLKRSSLTPQQTTIITFHYETAQAARKLFPNREVYWLVGSGKDKKTGELPRLDEMIQKARAAKLDGLNLDYRIPLDTAAVKKVKDAGLKLYVWTLDDPVKAAELVQAGVDGITTNRPGALRKDMAERR